MEQRKQLSSPTYIQREHKGGFETLLHLRSSVQHYKSYGDVRKLQIHAKIK